MCKNSLTKFKGIAIALVLLLFFTNLCIAQNSNKQAISGKVIDSLGKGVAAVSVIEQANSKNQTQTNQAGEFTITLNMFKQATLLFKHVNYNTHTHIVVNNKPFTIKLNATTNTDLDEVVVNGYQRVKKERATGSVTSISSTDISKRNLQSVDQILAGTVAGVTSIQSGRPGEDAKVVIRGLNSLTGSTAPVWIVDGVPMQGDLPNLSDVGSTSNIFQSGIGNIAPEDIENVTILKDAAASAIYGARAANGVIVITTKRGFMGPTKINVNLTQSITQRPYNNITMMNSEQKIKFEQELFNQYGYSDVGYASSLLSKASLGVISAAQANAAINKLKNTNTNWFKELFREGISNQATISLSGGNENTKHYMLVNLMNENGIQLNNSLKRARFDFKIDHNFNRKLLIQSSISTTFKNEKITGSIINPLQYALFANPYETVDGYDQSWDNTASKLRNGLQWETLNAKQEMLNNTNINRYLDLQLLLKAEFKVNKQISLTSQLVYNGSNNNSQNIEAEKSYTNFKNNWNTYQVELTPDDVKGSLREGSSYALGYSFRNSLQYNNTFNGKHIVSVFAGQEITDRTSYQSFHYSPVFDQQHRIVGYPELTNIDYSTINFTKLGGTGKYISKLSSFFTNASYSYKDRYVFSGSVRYDGSDIIGNNNQFTPLWNSSAKWNIHKEKFFKSNLFNTLSVRGGYGFTGYIDKNALPFVTMLYGSSIQYDGTTVPTSFSYSNPNVKWQTKKDINIGVDFSILKSRVDVKLNYYYNTTLDVLDQKAMPISSGRSSVTENVASILNKGIEAELSIILANKKGLYWSVKGNAAHNTSRLFNTYYKQLSQLPLQTSGGGNRFVENYAVDAWFGYRFAGVNPSNGGVQVYTNASKSALYNMDKAYVVTDTTAKPTPVYLGQKQPPFAGGFSTNIVYKNFSFSTAFDFMVGHQIKSFNTFKSIDSKNRHTNDMQRWQAYGDITTIPALSSQQNAFGRYLYDVMLESGDFLRCNFVSVGYDFNKQLISKLGFKTLNASIVVNNVFTLTKYKGIDPLLMGGLGYPNSRRYTFSIKFNL